MKKISICVTTYNRPETIDSFKAVLADERVSEVIIVDDCSTKENYNKLIDNVLALKNTKVKLYRNNVNQGVYKVSVYTFFQQNEQVSISLNGTILSSGVFNDNYGQCILTISQDNTTMNLVNTTNTNLNLLLPTGIGLQSPINASIIIERLS